MTELPAEGTKEQKLVLSGICYTLDMLSSLRNKLEDLSRKSEGKEVLDRDLADFLEIKYKNQEDRNDARFEILSYLDDLELRSDLLKNKTALDIGSSKHFFDEYCKHKYGTDFVSLDIDFDNLGTNHEKGVVADARSLPFKGAAFDLVISHASMPHLFVPVDNDEGNFIPIEGEVKEQVIGDILSVFRESYRVVKLGGQIRMSTLSEAEENYYKEIRYNRETQVQKENGEWIDLNEEASYHQQIARARAIKEALEIFEKESGAQCTFKEEKYGGLIIIKKVS